MTNKASNKIFLAGICGTFMAGIAQLARARGFEVRGCDEHIYPPMSTLLEAQNIKVAHGYSPAHLGDAPADVGTVIIGNALSRGNPLVEFVLDNDLPFCSAPEWLRANVLQSRTVIAVSGTHGKTMTASILAWLLECAGHAPGYLIGGMPANFAQSAALGGGRDGDSNSDTHRDNYFVIEADEYDSAFFDKRAKFVHYRPHIALLNNLEFDHVDIYDDLAQIQKQFHHLVRIVPGDGYVVVNADDENLSKVMAMGCWSNVVKFSVDGDGKDDRNGDGAEFRGVALNEACSHFQLHHRDQMVAEVKWQCIGKHNLQNAVAAMTVAQLVGIPPAAAANYLRDYLPVARRMETLFKSDTVTVYDDFAHHPTAIRHTIAAARAKHPHARIIAVVELRSNTMKSGAHGAALADALACADDALVVGANVEVVAGDTVKHFARGDEPAPAKAGGDEIIAAITRQLSGYDIIITMSNGDFDGLPRRIADTLAGK